MCYPDPRQIFPISGTRQFCLLKNAVTNPNIIVGDYTYYEDPDDIRNFQRHVIYQLDSTKRRLIIGNFCQIASEVKFLMDGMDHRQKGFSNFPFEFLEGELENNPNNHTGRKDTIIGNDVWIGTGAIFMPGVEVADGAIIKPYSVVSSNVAPYTVVIGNPAYSIEQRFDTETINFLLRIQWWYWPIMKIAKNAKAITEGNMLQLHAELKNNQYV
jgi:virginiamycin A acetyltransferase